jgi:hypothetical protein
MSRAEILACGFGLAGLILAPQASPLLISVNETFLHQKFPEVTVALGFLVDFTLLGLLCAVAVFGVSRLPEGISRRLGFVFFIYLGLRFARHIFLLWVAMDVEWVRSTRTLVVSRFVVRLACALLILLAIASARRFYSTLQKFGFLLPGISIFAGVMWFQLARSVALAERVLHRQAPSLAAPFPGPPLKHRVIWIVYDELSYREAFEKATANGLSLPAFESLRAESVSFRNVVPAAYLTEYAVPSLLLGLRVENTDAGSPRELSVRLAGTRHYTKLDPQATIFGELHRQRLNSAAVGWYYPYCDLLAPVVSSCEWETGIPMPVVTGMSGEQSVVKNVVGLTTANVEQMLGHVLPQSLGEITMRQANYRQLLSSATAAIANPGTSLVFLHLPVPHPFGFYDRKTGQLASTGSYLDNLALADRTLQVLLDAVHHSEENNVTTVIVTSDHSWRVAMWRNTPGWTNEDAAAAPAELDPRIPLLVRFPNEKQPLEIEKPFQAIRSRSLISGILSGQVETPEAVHAWAESDDSQ